jgi:hypothetical protein
VPLIVEDGSNVSGANTYVSLAYFKQYCLDRNIDISNFDTATLTGFAFDAMDFLESFRDRFKGVKTNPTQSTQWPRTLKPDPFTIWDQVGPQAFTADTVDVSIHVQIDGIDIADNEIPIELLKAQCQLMVERSKGVDLLPTTNPNRTVRRQTIGPITTEYFSDDTAPLLPAFDVYLYPLLSGGTEFIKTTRI